MLFQCSPRTVRQLWFGARPRCRGIRVSRDQQRFCIRLALACLAVVGRRRVLVPVLLVVSSLAFSNSIHLRIKPQPDRNVSLEWNSETGATYAIYWRNDFSDRWHLLDGGVFLLQRV